MNSKKPFFFFTGMVLLIMALIIFIRVIEPGEKGISRALACRVLALSLTDEEECRRYATDDIKSHLPENEIKNWYTKYIDCLYGIGVLDNDDTVWLADEAMEDVTYRDLYEIAKRQSEQFAKTLGYSDLTMSFTVSESEWWNFFEHFIKLKGVSVEKEQVMVYGTAAVTEDAVPDILYTNSGDYGICGIDADMYVDQEIAVWKKGDQILRITDVISDTVLYRNIYIAAENGDHFTAYLGSITRKFSLAGGYEKMANQIVDLTISRGKLQKITVKKDRISGKVLSVDDAGIEIEGYGFVPTDLYFKVFKTYGEFEVKSRKNIVVGYDNHEFVVADGMLCAALEVREMNAQIIRVRLMNDDFSSVYHDKLVFSADSGLIVTYGEEKKQDTLPGGEKFAVDGDNEHFEDGRITIRPANETEEIYIDDLNRSQGIPSYQGTIEVRCEEQGLTVVNELYLEDYLKKVVPSEMPAGYEKEALKAQAVCARTYAYMQITANGYGNLGAHVDDSINYQVYNNIHTDPRTDEAVNETYGELVTYNGEPVSTYYYSTSCGVTTDGSIWGSPASKTPYLISIVLRYARDTLDLTDNTSFAQFIKNRDFDAFDSSFTFFRWETVLTQEMLCENISGIGEIKDIEILERGAGGIVKKMKVTGSDGTKNISGEGSVRSTLGNSKAVITGKDGREVTGWSSLPSSFLTVDKEKSESGEMVFHIYGGGYGHGVGMSQNGAQGMAVYGMDYKKILEFFYDGISVEKKAASH